MTRSQFLMPKQSMRSFISLSIVMLVLIVTASSLCQAQHKHHRSRPVKADVSVKKISKKDIPPEVMDAFAEKYPTAEIKGQLKQVREKVVFYEIESLDSGKTRDVIFQSDGALVEVAESIEEDQLPQNIQGALREKYPDGEILNAVSVTRGEHLEFEITLQVGKKTAEVVVNLAGKIFPIQ